MRSNRWPSYIDVSADDVIDLRELVAQMKSTLEMHTSSNYELLSGMSDSMVPFAIHEAQTHDVEMKTAYNV